MLAVLSIAPGAVLAEAEGGHWHDGLRTLMEMAEQHRGWALLGLATLDALSVVLLLPAFVVAASAGFLFGVTWGTALMTLSTTLGALAAHELGRRWLRARAEHWLYRHPRLGTLVSALTEGGWRGVMLLRFVPFFPFKTSNYVLGALDIRLLPFFVGTLIGVVPMNMITVAAGALADDVLTHGGYRSSPLNAVVLVIAVAAAALLGWRAHRALYREPDRGDA